MQVFVHLQQNAHSVDSPFSIHSLMSWFSGGGRPLTVKDTPCLSLTSRLPRQPVSISPSCLFPRLQPLPCHSNPANMKRQMCRLTLLNMLFAFVSMFYSQCWK